MNKINEILNIVRKANPETKELSFGAWVRDKSTGTSFRIAGGTNDVALIKSLGEIPKHTFYNSDVWEILGHPLYPSHLLVALDTTKETGMTEWFVGSNGQFDKRTKDGSRLFKLNLTQPLEPQLQYNPELVETLYKLLKE